MKPVLTRQQLLARRCRALDNERACLPAEIDAQLAELPGWSYRNESIERSYAFRDYHETIAFVNALAWIVHAEDHHPDLVVSYNRCVVRWNTHSVAGVSENDFICAARADSVFARAG